MIGHVLRLAWNRRRERALVLAELTLSFLVLCLVFGVSAFFASNWRRPLGFDWRDVVMVEARTDVADGADVAVTARGLAAARAVEAALRSHPEIVAATPSNNVPYTGSTSTFGLYSDRRLVQFLWMTVRPEARGVLRLELVAGRWLARGDEALGYTPVVIDRTLARTLFGEADPLGRSVPRENQDGSPRPWQDPRDELRVVGVVEDFRKSGEPSPAFGAAFAPVRLEDPERGRVPRSYLVRLAPGIPAAFEQTLVRNLSAAAPSWSFRVESLAELRRRSLRAWLLPLGVGAAVAVFLVATVGMGLIGVLWQDVTRRNIELGVRRAFGSSAREVQGLILLEVAVLAGIAATLGSLLFLQLPLLGAFPSVGSTVYLGAAAAAFVVLLGFVLLSALYPSWLATRVHPSEALRWE